MMNYRLLQFAAVLLLAVTTGCPPGSGQTVLTVASVNVGDIDKGGVDGNSERIDHVVAEAAMHPPAILTLQEFWGNNDQMVPRLLNGLRASTGKSYSAYTVLADGCAGNGLCDAHVIVYRDDILEATPLSAPACSEGDSPPDKCSNTFPWNYGYVGVPLLANFDAMPGTKVASSPALAMEFSEASVEGTMSKVVPARFLVRATNKYIDVISIHWGAPPAVLSHDVDSSVTATLADYIHDIDPGHSYPPVLLGDFNQGDPEAASDSVEIGARFHTVLGSGPGDPTFIMLGRPEKYPGAILTSFDDGWYSDTPVATDNHYYVGIDFAAG